MKPTHIFIRFVLATLCFTSLSFPQRQPVKPATRGDLIRRRMEWFYRQRAYLLKHIPPGARLPALKQMDQMLAEEGRSSAPSTDVSPQPGFDVSSAAISSTRWALIGPEPTDTPYNDPIVAGRVTALAVDPTNANVVYAGAADGGVWKTTDGGIHWTPLTDTQPSLAVGSIAIDPSNHSTIYVGTGEENFSADSYFGAGILKSTNGGSSWTQIKGPFAGYYNGYCFYGGADYIGGIAIQPGSSSVILAAVEQASGNNHQCVAVYRTEDGGATWWGALPDPSCGYHGGTAVLFDPSDGNIAYAASYY